MCEGVSDLARSFLSSLNEGKTCTMDNKFSSRNATTLAAVTLVN